MQRYDERAAGAWTNGQPDDDDDAGDDRYALTALGEALVAARAEPRFRGFGPCAAAERAG